MMLKSAQPGEGGGCTPSPFPKNRFRQPMCLAGRYVIRTRPPRNRFRQAGNRFLGSLKGLQIRALYMSKKQNEGCYWLLTAQTLGCYWLFAAQNADSYWLFAAQNAELRIPIGCSQHRMRIPIGCSQLRMRIPIGCSQLRTIHSHSRGSSHCVQYLFFLNIIFINLFPCVHLPTHLSVYIFRLLDM